MDYPGEEDERAMLKTMQGRGISWPNLTGRDVTDATRDVEALVAAMDLPLNHHGEVLDGYGSIRDVVWLQEEPENMGAWPYWKKRFCGSLLNRYPFSVVARPASASPATGSSRSHKMEQETLLAAAFGGP